MKKYIKKLSGPVPLFFIVAIIGYLLTGDGRFEEFAVFVLAFILAKQFEKEEEPKA